MRGPSWVGAALTTSLLGLPACNLLMGAESAVLDDGSGGGGHASDHVGGGGAGSAGATVAGPGTGGSGATPECTTPEDCTNAEVCDAEACTPFVCGIEPMPVAPSRCPAVCSDCAEGVCTIACRGDNACKDDVLTCPEGLACNLVCAGKHACQGASLQCPSGYACETECTSGDGACDSLSIQCARTGACSIHCDTSKDACHQVEMACGLNACKSECEGKSAPSLDCAESCDCIEC